eukprot:scaffold193032_cov51-Prasinocladus_malaysianus.AAC.2
MKHACNIIALHGEKLDLYGNCPFYCSFYDREAPIYTMSRFLPPSKVLEADVTNSIIGDGCVVRANATISHSVVGLRSLIAENAVIEDALIMGADYYET